MPYVIHAVGTDPMLDTENAPMDVAIAGSATVAFPLSGHVCTSSNRVYVREAVHDEFVDVSSPPIARTFVALRSPST